MKKVKKFLSVFLALLMMATIIPMSSITANATTRTPDDAMGWCQSELGHSLDYDGWYGAQCVDLIAFYYQWLGVTTPGGNGCDYASNALPNGWTRVQGGQPQKGDILVYSGNAENPNGHVGIYESDYSHYHQNVDGPYVSRVTYVRYDGFSNPYWGYIRPNWGSGNTYTISYNANGGTGAPASQTKAQGTTLIITETVPTRKGYTFLGWSTSSTATTATYCAGSHFTTDANTTLYAVWRADEYSGICGENNLTWHLNVGTGVLTIFGNGAMDNYTSSSKQPWYDYRDFIKTVVINDGVTKIGINAFASCTNLVNISIGESVTEIGQYAFSNTGYSNNTSNFENGVLYIDEYLIMSDSNTLSGEYAIKEGTKVISDGAFFYNKNLTSITIPDSVTSLSFSSFSSCSELTEITVNKSNLNYSSDEYGVLFNKDKTEVIRYPQGNICINYSIPDSVTKIGDNAFSGCKKLTCVIIPDSVTEIGDGAFGRCGLASVTIPDSVTSIGTWAFDCCSNLTEITLPDSMTEIKNNTFTGCNKLKSVTIPASITKVGVAAFANCSNIENVYYIGTEKQWDIITFQSDATGTNEDLTNANIHYCEEKTEKQPTCEEDGYTAGLYCTECKEFVKDAQVIPATGHNYNKVVTNPTCTEAGYTTYTCSCGDSYIGNYVNALGHTYNSVITQPTCTETGYTTYTCACGESYVANVTPATGHSYKNGTCVNCGKADSTTPSEPDTPDEEFSINIQRPSRTTIRYKDGIVLHANIEGELPEGAQVTWYVSNDNFDGGYLDDGMSCVFVSKNNGYTTIYAVIEDVNGNELAVDSIELRSKAGFFDKIGGFFRSLFGSTTIYEY